MQLVLNAPMAADSGGKTLNITVQTQPVVSSLQSGGFTVNSSFRFNHANTPEAAPMLRIQQMLDSTQQIVTANFPATVPFIQGLMKLVGNVFELGLEGPIKQLCNILMKVSLIAFERQDIVGPLRRNRLGNRGLCPHGIKGHDAALEVEDGQQFGDGGDFVGLAIDFDPT